MLYKPQVRSRHPSHSNLKKDNVLMKISNKSVVRFGSSKFYGDSITNGGNRVEINTIEAVSNSANKLKMKTCFTRDSVKTAKWWTFKDGVFCFQNNPEDVISIEELPFPIISKNIRGSRGLGNAKHNSLEIFEKWLTSKLAFNSFENYILEEYKPFVKEYRLHVTANGCFYACRKMIKRDTPTNKRWYRNDSNCVWVLETNDLFDKPNSWDDIVKESVKSLLSVGLDIGAVDVKVQSSSTKSGEPREYSDFFIIEINSAPSFGDITEQKYITELNNLLKQKANDK